METIKRTNDPAFNAQIIERVKAAQPEKLAKYKEIAEVVTQLALACLFTGIFILAVGFSASLGFFIAASAVFAISYVVAAALTFYLEEAHAFFSFEAATWIVDDLKAEKLS